MHEQRQDQRRHGPFRGAWRSASQHRQAGILDIGPGGCFVDGMGGPSPGERVQVSVTIHQCSVALAGEVLHTDRVQGFAVVFTDNPPESIARLHQLLCSTAVSGSQ